MMVGSLTPAWLYLFTQRGARDIFIARICLINNKLHLSRMFPQVNDFTILSGGQEGYKNLLTKRHIENKLVCKKYVSLTSSNFIDTLIAFIDLKKKIYKVELKVCVRIVIV